jgi:hypothetical protein
MDSKRLEELCQMGESADTLLRQGRTREALKEYENLMKSLERKGDIDSYLMAKVTLGVLRCQVKLGDFKNAFAVWNATLDDGLHGIGIYALESAQTTVRDMLTYDMLCAYLHTLADADQRESSAAVNHYMSRVCEHVVEEADRATLRMAINNWKHHLKEIFSGTLPHDAAIALIRFEKTLGEPVKPQPIEFPLPSPWEKPSDFAEMSRVMQLRHEGKTRKVKAG